MLSPNLPAELFGPWTVEGCEVRIDCDGPVRLAVSRDGVRLTAVPPAVREGEDYAWIKVAHEAAKQRRRDLRALLEDAMAQEVAITDEEMAFLALDPVGRPMLAALVFETPAGSGRPLPGDWTLETLDGEIITLAGPALVAHPAQMGPSSLERWNLWLNRQPFRQPFKQIRREIYAPNGDDLRAGTFSDRFAGEVVRWDQARALLEGRGWYRVTKTGAERIFARAALTAHVEFRTPASRGFSMEDVVLNRVYFLPRGEQAVNRANPGLPLDRVPTILFSETLRDVALAAHVARQAPAW